MRFLYRASCVFADGLLWLGGLALVLMMLHVTADVAGKYLLGHPILGTLEMVTFYYMVAAVFLPLAVVQKLRGQIIVDIATQHLPPRQLALVEAIVSIVTFVFLCLLTWYGATRAIEMTIVREKMNAIHFPADVWPSRWIVVLGCGGAAILCLIQIANDFAFATTGRRLVAEIEEPKAH